MRNKRLKELLNAKRLAASAVVAVSCLGLTFSSYQSGLIANLESYNIADDLKIENGDTIQVSDEAVPTAKAKTTTKKTTKTTTTYEYMSVAATKNKTSSTSNTTVSNDEKTEGTKNIKTKTTVKTTVTTTLKKKSKKKKIVTKVQTTVQTTTTTVTASPSSSSSTSSNGNINITSLCPKTDSNVLKAYELMNFKTIVDSSESNAGHFIAKEQKIVLNAANADNAYHELGHFVAFTAGNLDKTDEFEEIYKAEKAKYQGRNSTYVLSDATEYFAESYRQYVLGCDQIKTLRPKTYAYMKAAVNVITEERAKKLFNIYSSAKYWN